MPSTSLPEQRLMSLAYRDPSKVRAKNRGVLKMPRAKLKEYMSLKRASKPRRPPEDDDSE